jgi:hypothetical protein
MSAPLGWALATLAAEWGIDEIQRWMDEKTGHRHTPGDHPLPQVPTEPSSPALDPCWDPIEAAEFKEMEDAATDDCDEEY